MTKAKVKVKKKPVNKPKKISDNEYKLKIIADDSVHNFKMGNDFELLPL